MDGISQLIKDYDTETKALKNELLRICWFMRGSVSFNESHCLTYDERVLVSNLIESNLETTKETGMNFF